MCIRSCKRLLYADDLQIYLGCLTHELDEFILLIKDDIACIYAWAVANRLKFNFSKTKAILFRSASYINMIDQSTIKLSCHGAEIPIGQKPWCLQVNLR